MPNQAAIASVGIIAASVAVAAAIAVYESPEIRRMAEDLRRRIAIALHSLGDNIDPNRQDQPLFNRPEDAEGFLQSRGVIGAELGVDADEESRRRQREELMYWNALREQKLEKQRGDPEKAATRSGARRGSCFDDFLQQDQNAEKGTYVFNTGAQVKPEDEGLRRRGIEGFRGLNASVYANPFADENGIDFDDHPGMEVEGHSLSPGRDEVMSDIYDVSPRPIPSEPVRSETLSLQPLPEVLFDFNESQPQQDPISAAATPGSSRSSVTLDRELQEDEYITAGQNDREDAYASIQAWAQNSNQSFYSPLPMSPAALLSEPEIISDSALTPTGSATPSIAESGEDLGNDAASSKAGDYDVMSEDEGMATPSSWSEVGSVISESDGAIRA